MPSSSTSTDDGSTPGGGGGGGGGGGSAIHGPLPAIASVTLSMISAATTSAVGPYTLYTGGISTPTIRVAGVNAGNRIRLYVWDANSGPYICTTVSAEQTATTANEDLIISPGLTNGYWIVIAVLDDGSGTNTGCPSIADVTGQVVSFVYYNLTVVATPPTSMTLISPASNSSYNTRPTVQVGGLTSGDTVGVYSDSSCTTLVGSTTATGASADITLTTSISAGAATLYSKRTTSGGTASSCSTVNLSYTVLVPTGGLPTFAGIALSMTGVGAPADYGGGLYVYSGAVAKPTLSITGVNVGNRIKIYQWEGAGLFTCTNLVAETGADATTVAIQVTTAATEAEVVYVPVVDDGSGSDTGCPDVNAFPAFPYAYYIFTTPFSAPTSLSFVTPSSSPGRVSTPTMTVDGVSSGDVVSLYSDNTCTTQIASDTASSTSINLTTSALSDGTYDFYAKRVSGGISSSCSTATLNYVLSTTMPTPSSLALLTPGSSPGVNKTPTITVSGVVSGDTINLYTENTCTSSPVGQTDAFSTTADVTVSTAMTDGTYTFYSRAVNGSLQSACSSASVAYILDSYYSKVTAISMVTPATNSGVSATPTVRVSGLLTGDDVFLYKTSDCSGSTVGGIATASGVQVDITTSSLGGIGQYSIYAIRSQGDKFSDCSVANVIYSVDIPPSGLSLYSPATSPGRTVNPTIRVSGVVSGDTVSLFTDSTCSTQVATGTASGTTIDLQSSVLTDNTYEFYANRTKSGYTTSCSSAHVQYVLNTVISAPTVTGAYGFGTSVVTGDLPHVTVSGVVSGDVIKIYTDASCTAEVASGAAFGTSLDVALTSPLADGYTYTFYAKSTNGYLYSDCSTTSATYVLDDPTSVNFYKIYSIDAEGNNGMTSAVILSRAKPYATTIYFDTMGSTGTSGVDYNLTGSSVTIGANQTSAAISYDLLSDGVADGEKSLYLSMTHTSKSGVIIGSMSQFRQYILDTQATVDSVHMISQNCAVMYSGKLKCWGYNGYGTVGDGTNTNRTTPVVVDSGTSYLSIDSAYMSNCGITSGALALKCWGYNGYGGLGNGTLMDLNVPTVIDSGVQYRQVSAGYRASCGVTFAGDLKCWGQSDIVASLTPVVIDSGVSYSSVSAGVYHACAITSTGVLKCWGSNASGELGDGTTTMQSAPVVIDPGVTYSKVSAGQGMTCAITTAGVLKCWGQYYSYETLVGQYGSLIPIVIDAGVSYSKIDINTDNACAITTGGILKCWGRNIYGGSGLGYGVFILSPTVIDSAHTYSDVRGTCAITNVHKLICWSSAQNFIYGNYRFSAQDAVAPTASLSTKLYSTVSIYAADSYYARGCAITTAGQLNCWGLGWNGDGSDSNTRRYYPVVVDDTNVYSKVDVGTEHTCAIQTNGVLKCWGRNTSNQLGIGGISFGEFRPIVVDSGTLYSDIASRLNFSCGITVAGVQKCWGQLPHLGLQATPIVVDSGTLYSKISVNGSLVCGLTVAGNIRCWGYSNLYKFISLPAPTTFDSGTVYSDLSVSSSASVCGITLAGVLKCFFSSDKSNITVVDSGTTFSKVIFNGSTCCGITTTGVVRCWSGNPYTLTIVDAGTAYSMIDFSGAAQFGITTAGVMKSWANEASYYFGSGNNFSFPFNRSANLETQ